MKASKRAILHLHTLFTGYSYDYIVKFYTLEMYNSLIYLVWLYIQ